MGADGRDGGTWSADAQARIVSVPVSDYIAFEHACTWQNVEAGESVRWLDRAHATDLLLPGNDFWLIDRRRVLYNLFDGQGRPIGKQLVDDPEIGKVTAAIFEAVWERATDHAEFRIVR
ncbi:hypothetical protein HNR21_001759 [Actinomadura cellulosilytica]|uniref:DUF6879 domain-containing protein n=1 Tax=Thermomonospora cellulosilytica TaxID=1411118 RepID=A0A7W3MVX6_9ACTN|nr:DUF6879 family protein [Thermomonospora cellulosilytica]MBA9002877.1 hypothetical protein [Thermomonospora cellulosilytica]